MSELRSEQNTMSDERESTGQDAAGLVHDLRHSLFALQTGIALLPELQDDQDQFRQVHELLQREIGQAIELVRQLLGERESSAAG